MHACCYRRYIRFAKNGIDLGVAFASLPSHVTRLVPAICIGSKYVRFGVAAAVWSAST
jgi:hypothetical protein